MKSLAELAILYDTDKQPKDHNYVEIYEKIFNNFSVTQLLEIGVGRGSSLKMWSKYFPNAEIFGMELFGEENKRVWNSFNGEIPDVTIIEGDSREIETWGKVPNNIDIIIDDGDHHPDSQILSFMHGFYKLRSHGLYIIEDTHCNFEKRYTEGKDILYTWVMNLIINQQCPNFATGGDFYKYRQFMQGISRDIYSYHFYKSLIIFEKA